MFEDTNGECRAWASRSLTDRHEPNGCRYLITPDFRQELTKGTPQAYSARESPSTPPCGEPGRADSGLRTAVRKPTAMSWGRCNPETAPRPRFAGPRCMLRMLDLFWSKRRNRGSPAA